MSRIPVCRLEDIPKLGARRFHRHDGAIIAIFRNATDSVFALRDQCPHKGGPLSQGIVFGDRVACPLHNWVIDLDQGCAVGPDVGCTRTHEVKLDGGRVFLKLAQASNVMMFAGQTAQA